MMRPDRAGPIAVRRLAALCLFVWLALTGQGALAVESVRVPADADAIDLTGAVEHFGAQGDRIQVSTAPGPDGIVRRIEVSALEAGGQPSWIVFALTNDSDEQLTRNSWSRRTFVSSVRASSGQTSARRESRRSPPARGTRPSATTRSTPTCFG